MAERKKKKIAKRLPRRRVHSMALGGVIKHTGWKLSRFIPCSRGVASFCCCCCCCSCKMKFIHEHKLEANLLTCVSQARQTRLWRCAQTESSSHVRPLGAGAPVPPCPLLPCAACPAPGTIFGVQTRLHSFINDEFLIFFFKLLYRRAPNPGRKKIQSCHSLVASQISLH